MLEKFLQFVSVPLPDHLSVCGDYTDCWWPLVTCDQYIPVSGSWSRPGTDTNPLSSSTLTLSSPVPHANGENQNYVHLFIQNSDITLSLPSLAPFPIVPPGLWWGTGGPLPMWTMVIPYKAACMCQASSYITQWPVAQLRILIPHIHTYYYCGLTHN